MTKLQRIRTATKKVSRTILQIAICSVFASLIMSIEAAVYAFVGLVGIMGLIAVGMILSNIIYDDEMRVRLFRKRKSAYEKHQERLARVRR